MKTLKKTLCLVLAVVMAVGVLVIPANAATNFPDDADITHDEAVAVLNGLGIFEGDDKGNFNPDTVLKRAEAAKIIAVLMQGKEAADDYVPSTVPFTDIADYAGGWAVNYIAYCADNGIIGGNGDGTFNPDGDLTGHAFAKMLLCALGYDGNNEGFGGSSWAKNVEAIARKEKMNAGISAFQYSAPLSRDDAAQMTYNAINNVVQVLGYTGGTDIELPGGVTIKQGAERDQEGATTLAEDFNLITLDGTSGKAMVGGGTDTFGRPSEYQIAIDAKNAADRVVLYSQPIPYVKQYTASASTSAVTKDLKALTEHSSVTVVTNGDAAEPAAVSYADIAGKTGNGYTVEVYASVDDSKEIDTVVVIENQLALVNKVSSSQVDLKTGVGTTTAKGYTTTVSVTDDEDDVNVDWFETLSNYSKGDYIAIVLGEDDAILDMWDVETVTGPLTKTGTKSGDNHHASYTIDGTTYKVGAGAQKRWSIATSSAVEPKLSADDDVIAVIDGNLIMDFVDAETTKTPVTSMYIVATYAAAGEWGDTNMLQAVMPDGEVITGVIYDQAIALTALTKGGYNYTIDSKTGAYKVTAGDKADTYNGSGSVSEAGVYSLTGSDITVKTNSTRLGGLYFASDVKFITVTGDKGELDVAVRNGRQNVTLTAGDVIIVTEDANGNLVVSTVYITDDDQYTAPSVKGEDLLYFKEVKATGNGLGDDGESEVTYYEAYLNGEKTSVTLYTSSGSNDVNPEANTWYSYTINENTGIYTLTKAKNTVVATETAVELALVNDVYYMSWAKASGSGDYDNVAKADLDATDAIVVDLTSGSDNIEVTSVDELLALIDGTEAGTVKVTLTYDSDAKTVDLIYVTSHGTPKAAD